MRDCSCGSKPGELHGEGCDVARCHRCGGQEIACGCVYEVNGIDREEMEDTHPEIYMNGATKEMWEKMDREWPRLPWSGEYPGLAECREYGFWSRWVSKATGKPIPDMSEERGTWQKCLETDEWASEGLNELYARCVWDEEKKKMVLPVR